MFDDAGSVWELIERRAAASPDPRLPRQIRLFVGSEMLVSREERLVRRSGSGPLTVVVMSPVAGG